MNGVEVAEKLAENNPGRVFAVSVGGDVVGVVDPGCGSVSPVYAQVITGEWAQAPAVLVDGRPMVEDWRAERYSAGGAS